MKGKKKKKVVMEEKKEEPRLTEQQQLDFLCHALLVLAEDLVHLPRASLAILILIPGAKAHAGVLRPRMRRGDGSDAGVCLTGVCGGCQSAARVGPSWLLTRKRRACGQMGFWIRADG